MAKRVEEGQVRLTRISELLVPQHSQHDHEVADQIYHDGDDHHAEQKGDYSWWVVWPWQPTANTAKRRGDRHSTPHFVAKGHQDLPAGPNSKHLLSHQELRECCLSSESK